MSHTNNTASATNGMVATSSPYAVEAGLSILKAGGNAADAAVAAAAVLTVTEPTSNGIGSDAFAIAAFGGNLYGLNGSGRSPIALSRKEMGNQAGEKIPFRGWLPVTVPGAPGAWHALWKRFGKLDFREVMEPAAHLAEKGYTVTPVLAHYWNRAVTAYKKWESPLLENWLETFAPGGQAPSEGDVYKNPQMAATLREIGATDSSAFYKGSLAEKICSHSKNSGGWLTMEDFKRYKPLWVRPLSVSYGERLIWELPPNGQGISALEALKIFDAADHGPWGTVQYTHTLMEAVKLAMSDAGAYVNDPEYCSRDMEKLLDDKYIREQAALINEKALLPTPGKPFSGGTVYLATADSEGNMVSFIQSNYTGFGSGIVIPGTGISMQNRGAGFSLIPGHPNEYAPGKRPYHTIIPGFITDTDGTPVGPFGLMGGFMQPQGHVQLITALLDGGLDLQEAVDLPRWQWMKERIIHAETGFSHDTVQQLKKQGHEIAEHPDTFFGRAQIIIKDKDGYRGASDKRADGYAAGW